MQQGSGCTFINGSTMKWKFEVFDKFIKLFIFIFYEISVSDFSCKIKII